MCDFLNVITESNFSFLIAQWIAQAYSSLGQYNFLFCTTSKLNLFKDIMKQAWQTKLQIKLKVINNSLLSK